LQSKQFALTKARHCGGQEQRPIGVACGRAQQRLHLGLVEEANRVGLLHAWTAHLPGGIGVAPASVDAVIKDLAQQGDRVVDQLRAAGGGR